MEISLPEDLSAALARGAHSDRDFFERSAGRRFRIRPAQAREVDAIAFPFGMKPKPPGADECWFMVVCNAQTGVRFRLPFIALLDCAAAVLFWRDDQCQRYFEALASPQVLELTRRVAPGEGGT